MTQLFHDLRYALRTFRRSPGFTAAVVATLALGIGANMAIFTVLKSVLLDPLPFPDSERLVRLNGTRADRSETSVSYPDYLDWREQNRVFESLAAFSGESATLAGETPERLNAHVVSGNFFSTLGVRAELGRTFRPEDDLPGSPAIAVLSDELWRRRFGADRSILGRPILLDGNPRIVVGVATPRFRFYDYGVADLWTPLGEWARDPKSDVLDRGSHAGLYAIGRLKPGVKLAAARSEMDVLASRLAREYPKTNSGRGVKTEAFRESVVSGLRPALLVLSGSVIFLLLIAGANVCNLLIARATGRRRELAIRVAIGAGRGALVRQLLTESVALSILGGALGLALASGLIRLILRWRPIEIARIDEVSIDLRLLGAMAVSTVVTGLLFGLVPALRTGRESFAAAGRLSVAGPERGRFQSLLIGGEVALCLLLLVGSALLGKSFLRLRSVDPGFVPAGVLTARLDAPETNGPGRDGGQFFERVLEEARKIPGVSAASAVNPLPLTPANRQDGILLEGRPTPPTSDIPSSDVAIVDRDYFRAMRIPLLRGRGFLHSDDDSNPKVAVVSAALAKRFWPNGDALGRRFTNELEKPGQSRAWFTVVGIVGDIRLSLDGKPMSEVYYPISQRPMDRMTFVLRTHSGNPEAVTRLLASAIAQIDPRQPLYRVSPFETVAGQSLAERRFTMFLFAGFTALGLILSIGGIASLVGRVVASRTKEIGIRIALGATRTDVLGSVFARVLPAVAAGMLLGLAAAFAFRGAARSLLFEISPSDPASFLGAPAILAAAAFVAAFLPARRATRIDPVAAIRNE
jgi:putative ABC transport system permease protein